LQILSNNSSWGHRYSFSRWRSRWGSQSSQGRRMEARRFRKVISSPFKAYINNPFFVFLFNLANNFHQQDLDT
jgi:hypothetical protein